MNKKDFSKLGAEAILTGMLAPFVVGFVGWFIYFVISAYQVKADVDNLEKSIQEIKADVKETKVDVKELIRAMPRRR